MTDRSTAFRISRLLQVLATLLLVAVVAYAGAAIYFAAHLHAPQQSPTTATMAPGDTLRLATGVNLTNPGPFSLTHVTLVAHLELPGGTPWLATQSGPERIGPYATGTLPLVLSVPFASLQGTASGLLVNDTELPMQIWSNGTYASFGTWAAEVGTNYSWGAPFEGLAVAAGAPTSSGNGTVMVPLTITFQNHAPFDLAGTIAFALSEPSGAACGGTSIPVVAGSGQSFASSPTLDLPASCAGAATAYTATWTGDGLAVGLPGGELP